MAKALLVYDSRARAFEKWTLFSLEQAKRRHSGRLGESTAVCGSHKGDLAPMVGCVPRCVVMELGESANS